MATNGNGHHGIGQARRRGRRTRAQRKAKPSMPFWAKGLIAVFVLGIASVAAAGAAGFAYYQSYADELVAPDELAINQPSYGAKIYDRNGVLLYEYVDDQAGLRRPVQLENVAEAFLAATIATEDDSFFTNPGVNIKGLARAAWENSPFGDSAGVFEGSGGSSITQQLVKNVYIPFEDRQERSIDRKVKETVYAIELTRRYDKEQILEWYVNQISYGGLYNGVQAAALGYFGKSAGELTLAEAALLAGIPQSPAAYDPVNHPDAARARRNEILDLMIRQGPIQIGEDRFFTLTQEDIDAAKAADIVISERRFPIRAPHFVLTYVQPLLESFLPQEALFRDGLIVTTSLDIEMQDRTQEIMEGWILEFEEVSNSHNGAMMVVDPKTGEILTMIGSRDYFREDIEGKNNNATACNSPGSSFKPFAYLTTFKELGWGPGTIILDTPVEYPDPAGGEPFVPRNPSGNFQGPISIRNSLGNSLNIPANKAADAVGAQAIVNQAREVGFVDTFALQQDGGCSLGSSYGPAIATGGVDVTLEDMMFGYSTLANDGVMNGQVPFAAHGSGERGIDPIAILKVEDAQGNVVYDVNSRRASEQVIEPEFPYMVWDILTDPSAQCITFQCGGITIPGYEAGVKTGTSEPYDRNHPCARQIGETWAFGFSPDLVVGIWAGNSDNSCVDHIYSTSISFRAMRDTFIMAHEGLGVTAYPRPEGIEEAEVCVPSGMKPTPLCGRTTKDIFAKDKLPEEEDTWWQRVVIDQRSGQLATESTPPQYRVEEVMLVLPEDLLKTEEDRKRAEEWAKALGVPLAPTEASQGGGLTPGGGGGGGGGGGDPGQGIDLAAIISSPDAGDEVSGIVEIRGRADSEDFISYRIQYGTGISPVDWTNIVESSESETNGVLGQWDTTGLEPGVYTLQLQVLDSERGLRVAKVTVTVAAPDAGGP
jgi:membrane peptidoglycan carboxypeptidase